MRNMKQQNCSLLMISIVHWTLNTLHSKYQHDDGKNNKQTVNNTQFPSFPVPKAYAHSHWHVNITTFIVPVCVCVWVRAKKNEWMSVKNSLLSMSARHRQSQSTQLRLCNA